MLFKVKHKLFLAVLMALFLSPLLLLPAKSEALGFTCADGFVVDIPQGSTIPSSEYCADHMTPLVECEEGKNEDGSCKIPVDCVGEELNEGNCKILDRLLGFINILSGLVGVVVVAMIIIGGIQYSTAGSDPQKVKAAKGKVFNALLALLAYIFMFSFLQWIVPGGIF